MTPLEFLSEARADYLAAFRRTLQQRRAEDATVIPEVWVRPGPQPGADEPPPPPMCVDILGGSEAEPTIIAVSNEQPPEGALVGTMRIGGAQVRVYPVTWEVFLVWVRQRDPDWAVLDAWRAKWIDPEREADPADEDGLHGVVHFLGPPVAEGGGYLLEVDFGSAPIEALTELLDALADGGATEIELGRSDGSELDAAVVAELRRADLSPQRFNELLAQVLAGYADAFERVEVVAPQEIAVYHRGAAATPHKVFSGNLFMRVLRVGVEARAKEVYRFCRGQFEIGTADDAVPDLAQLRPVIKDDRFFENIRQQTDSRMTLLARPLVADLWVCCVWDTPNGMRFVPSDEPEKYGMTADEMHARAVRNFLDERGDVELTEHGPLIVARTGDSYDATLLLDDRFWAEMAAKVDGELLACAPAREVVLIAGSGTPGAVAALRQVAEQVAEGGDHLITETILRRTGEGWAPLTPAVTPTAPQQDPRPADPPAVAAKRPWWKFW